jgi:hypothetical protein
MVEKTRDSLRLLSIIRYGLMIIILLACNVVLALEPAFYPQLSIAAVTLEPIDATSLRLILECPDSPLQFMQYEGENRVWLEYEHEGFTDEPGKASLPLITRFIAIPPDARLQVNVLAQDTRTVENVRIVPVAVDGGDALSEAWVDDSQWLSENTPYPGESVTVGQGMRLRNLWLVPVTIAPARYYPQDHRLEIIRHLDIQITLQGGTFRDPSIIQGPLVESYDRMYKKLVANYEMLELDQQPIRGTYLIICPNNQTVVNALQDLLIWKTREGYRAQIVTTAQTGSTLSSIRNYIRNAYNNWDYPPEFVCLVGDAIGSISIPSGYTEYDHYYTMMNDDILPDVAVGRLSCENTTTLQTIVNKIVHYEEQPYVTQTAWYRKALMVAGESASGVSTIHTKRSIRWRLLQYGYTQVDTMWYTMGGSVATAIANSINGGIGTFNYRGFIGMSDWTNDNTDALTNGFMLPVVITLTCGTGSFTDETSVAEGFLRAGTPTLPKGAIAAIGTATNATHTKYNNCMDIGIYSGIYDADIVHLGDALNYGKMELRRNYPGGEGDDFLYWNNLMGDPGLVVWKQIPLAMTATYDDTISLGTNTFPIHVTDSSQQPVEDAYACLWQQSGSLYQVGYTDQNGNVELNCGDAVSGSFYVTITKEGYIPHLGQTSVITTSQSIGLSEAPLDDDDSGMSQGNGDGIWNPNERVEIQPTIINHGTQSIQNIQATLTCDDPLLNISQGTGNFGTIPSGGSSLMTSAFVASLNPAAENSHLCRLRMSLQGTGFSQQLYLDYITASYQLEFVTLAVGGSNNVLEPGETANILITLRNDGNFSGNAISGILRANSNYLQVTDSVGTYGNIAEGDSAQNTADPFTIQVFTNVIPGTRVPLTLITTSSEGIIDTIAAEVQIQEVIGQGSPLGPDTYGYFCFDNTDGGFSQAPNYQWIEIDPHFGGTGTQIMLTDFANEEDDSKLVLLPFAFQYYGVSYDRITVCSNGWMAMGTQTYFEDFRNWMIPSPQGPPAMIAPFWDDLLVTSGSDTGKVYYWYDSVNHRFIAEWSRVPNQGGGSPQETFEVVLNNPQYYPTPTGDGEILFQYYHIVNVTGASSDNDYATVGIEDFSQTIGIEYTWMDEYPPQAATLVDGRAIKFTTAPGEMSGPPSITLTPTQFEVCLPQGSEGIDTLWIGNVGASPLAFSIQPIDEHGRSFVSSPTRSSLSDHRSVNHQTSTSGPTGKDHPMDDAVVHRGLWAFSRTPLPPEVDSSGGPDAAGYTWMDSNEPGGPNYNWVNLTGIGTLIQWGANPNDAITDPLDIGFDFPFYGNTFNTLRICSNGYITLSDSIIRYVNRQLPNSLAPANLIAFWWDDLNPYYGGGYYYWSNQVDTFVVTADGIMGQGMSGPRGGPYTFQAILTQDGTIKLQYYSMGSTRLNESTIGIQDGTKTIGLTATYNSLYVENSMAVQFSPPYSWLQVDPDQGLVAPGNSEGCRVSVETQFLEPGSYNAIFRILSNDIMQPSIDLNVTLTVAPNGQVPPTVGNILDQTISEGGTFATINLDSYVTDPNYTPQQMTWTSFGASDLTITIVNRVATITIPNPDWFGQETITFKATNPLNLWDSDRATFTVLSVNDLPVIDPGLPNITFHNDSSATLNLRNYEQDIEDPDSLLTWTFSGNVSVNIAISQSQLATFTAASGFVGQEQVIFTLHDTQDSTDTDTILVTVQPAADVPGSDELGIPRDYFLAQNYPNPFNPKTMIRFGLPEPSEVKLTIYNILGQVVAVPINGHLPAGYHRAVFETSDLASGVYFFGISTPKFSAIRKMVLLR